MSKETVTGRTPSLPELQSLKPEQAAEAVAAFREQYPDLYTEYGKVVAKGRFSAAGPQVQNIPRSALVDMDYSVIEHRVAGMLPVFAAPCGQTEKDASDDQ